MSRYKPTDTRQPSLFTPERNSNPRPKTPTHGRNTIGSAPARERFTTALVEAYFAAVDGGETPADAQLVADIVATLSLIHGREWLWEEKERREGKGRRTI